MHTHYGAITHTPFSWGFEETWKTGNREIRKRVQDLRHQGARVLVHQDGMRQTAAGKIKVTTLCVYQTPDD